MIMRDFIKFGSTRIDYTIVYSDRRKNASLAVYPMKLVEITVPHDLKKEHVQILVRKKADWIIKQILWFEEITLIDSSKEYVNGETYLYLGRQYRLKIITEDGKAQAKLIGKYLTVTLPSNVNVHKRKTKKTTKAAIWQWYREQLQMKISEAIRRYCKKLGIKEPRFMIKNQYKRWGSCTSKNQLIFNFRIAMAPMSQLEYVVAHEMCHIKYKDHSNKYWKLLCSIMPDYEIRKEALRKDGWQYAL